MPSNLEGIDFVGGPLDGFVQFVDFPVEQLERLVTVPINRNVMRMLCGGRPAEGAPATSVALYELRMDDATPRYLHRGSVQPSRCELADWFG